MRKRNEDITWDVAGRIKDLDQFTGSLVAPPRADADVIAIRPAPPTRVPLPRRSRIFLRGASGVGGYADLTLTAPAPRAALD